ncbi:hypothetical protein C5B41_16045 [Acinetobacter ursingii]|uniref:hypothetical protein n=1 Tax=Acinetobacter ursingii TaxID=108980 RepID=UPI000CF1FD35|nr:hypothetical protein [Acinetobacter ursingii]PPZ93233.1 hypothetical protein C5B41_16045 [Acinetobacter ursingii]
MKLKNTLFGSEPNRSDISKYNACVGNNGWVGMHSYIDGFQSSTVILLESLIKDVDKKDFDGFMWCLDTCVYPILFSARHFLELFLKQQVLRISYLKNKSEDDYEIKLKLLKTHDTHKLWKLFLAEVKSVCDIRLNKYLHKIHIFILQFHNIDSTGETFRYPYSQTNSLHLTNHSVIGLKRFYKEFLEFSKVASDFSYLTDYLLKEYRVGTYTEHLSRANIEELALSLPPKKNWTNRILKKYQSYVKDKYGAGSREFGDVLKIIKNNIEFNNIVSDEYKLGIDEQKLINFCLNCLMEPKQNLNLSLSDLATIRAIQEISVPIINGKYFSEDVHYLTEVYYKEYKSFNKHSLEDELDYVYEHLNRTIKGLEKLRQTNTINQIHIAFKNLFVCLLQTHKDDPVDIDSRPRSARYQFEDMFKDIIFN